MTPAVGRTDGRSPDSQPEVLQIPCPPVMGLDDLFTPGALQHLAGSRFFERGAAYERSNRVKKLEVGEEELTATVRGQRPYQVRLWVEDGGPGYSCTCPVGTEGLFCKHCVAVGVAFTSRKHRPHDSHSPDEPVTSDLESHLHSLPKKALVELLLEQARDDEFLRCKAALQVHSTPELGTTLVSLVGDAVQRAALGAAARALVESNRGAKARTLAVVEDLLPARTSARRAVVAPFRLVR